MILYKKFGNQGRLGNQLFQLAFILAMAKRGGIPWALPEWKFAKYFKIGRNWNLDSDMAATETVSEPGFEYSPGFNDPKSHKLGKIDFFGYFQSEKYFEDVWSDIRDGLKFEDWFVQSLQNRSGFIPDDNCVAVHLRRGDYASNDNYVHLSPEYYASYFVEHPELNFYIFSDDYRYCKFHFQSLENVEYVEGCISVEHMALMSMFKRHFIANSSFSWWAAKLAELHNDNVEVIRPDGLFAGELAKRSSSRDFYPERWEIRPLHQQIPLQDVTLVIPTAYDHKDRKRNLDLIVCMLQRNFKTNIIIGEQGSEQHFQYMSKWVKYIYFKGMSEFHRTKMLNEMIRITTTPIIINYDADVLVSPVAIYSAVKKIREGKADFVYPFERFARVPRIPYKDMVLKSFDVGVLLGYGFKGLEENARTSFGGIVVMNKDSFNGVSGENENFKSWGREDFERVWRYNKLGFKVDRVEGYLFHINHFVGENSFKHHAHYKRNEEEAHKVKNMTPDELREYIATWEWAKVDL